MAVSSSSSSRLLLATHPALKSPLQITNVLDRVKTRPEHLKARSGRELGLMPSKWPLPHSRDLYSLAAFHLELAAGLRQISVVHPPSLKWPLANPLPPGSPQPWSAPPLMGCQRAYVA